MKKLLLIIVLLTTTISFGLSNNIPVKLGNKVVTLLQVPPSISEILASPNPFSIKTTISFISVKDQEITFTVKNLLGKDVYSERINAQKGENNFDFYKNNLNPGMYLYSFQTTSEIVSKRLVIK